MNGFGGGEPGDPMGGWWPFGVSIFPQGISPFGGLLGGLFSQGGLPDLGRLLPGPQPGGDQPGKVPPWLQPLLPPDRPGIGGGPIWGQPGGGVQPDDPWARLRRHFGQDGGGGGGGGEGQPDDPWARLRRRFGQDGAGGGGGGGGGEQRPHKCTCMETGRPPERSDSPFGGFGGFGGFSVGPGLGQGAGFSGGGQNLPISLLLQLLMAGLPLDQLLGRRGG